MQETYPVGIMPHTVELDSLQRQKIKEFHSNHACWVSIQESLVSYDIGCSLCI